MIASEISKIFKKPGEVRLKMFVETVAAQKHVYAIGDEEGWAVLGDDDVDQDTDILPLFQHDALAERFRKEAGFEESSVEKIEMEELMAWLDELEQDGLMVAICPNPSYEGAIVEPLQLKEMLVKQL
jgi:Protein of unknown function (DUF2750)